MTSRPDLGRRTPLISTLADDPDYADVLELFIAELPDRIEALEQALDVGAWDTLRQLAHQMKGCGGSYGFDVITEVAAATESALREGAETPEIRAELGRLTETCRRAIAGHGGAAARTARGPAI